MLGSSDTICAAASPPGGGYRGVVRISGPSTLEILQRVLLSGGDTLRTATRAIRFATGIELGDPLGVVDAALMVWPTSRSYTGQPSAEVHLIGAEPILAAAVDRLREAGARLAAPGEFTLRAFLAGRIDLTQAEAVLGVIEADDREGLGAALDQLAGGVAEPLGQVRAEMLELLADVEAGLDFVEEDIQFIEEEELQRRLQGIAARISGTADRMRARGRSGDVPTVALYGRPNAGKSRLLNALSGAESAIVSSRTGTTRDPVEVRLPAGRQVLRVIDTAGLEAVSEGDFEADLVDQAQQLARGAAENADVRLWCVDASLITELERPPIDSSMRVATKIDLIDAATGDRLRSEGWLLTSATEGSGLDQLLASIVDSLTGAGAGDAAGLAATAARCRETLTAAAAGLQNAADVVLSGGGQELVAAELRMAMEAVGRVTGSVYSEEILDSIFGRFCIGK